MGLYIEVPDKMGWLQTHGEETAVSSFTAESISDDEFLVVAINNYMFIAAGVAFSESELKHILEEDKDAGNNRPRRYFIVSKKLLQPVCPEWGRYL